MIFNFNKAKTSGAFVFSGATFLSALLVSASSLAQVPPSSTEPGVIQKQFDERKEPISRKDQLIKTPSDEAKPSAALSKEIFTLKSVNVVGASVYSESDLEALAAQHIGNKVSLADLNSIAKAITNKYRNDGYVLSSAVVVPQSVKAGTVKIQVIEGSISKVTVTGELKDKRGLIDAMGRKITTHKPVKSSTIERYLLLIDDLPGVTAKGVVKPGANPGEAELLINVEHTQFEGALTADNRGSRYLGYYRGTAVGAVNNAFGLYDRSTIRGIMSSQPEEIKFLDVYHEEQIGSDGGKVLLRGAVSKVHPGEDLDIFDIDGKSYLFDVSGKYPLIRSRAKNLDLKGGFKALDTDTDILNTDFSEDKVRVFHAGAALDFSDSFRGVNLFDIEVSQGIDALGATDDGAGRSRTNGEHSFMKANLQATRIQDLTNNFSLLLSAAGQISADPLLSSEEFSLGGSSTYGRAYDGGEIVGDHGVGTGIELRYGKPVDLKWLNSYQLYGFYDIGAVWNKDPIAGEAEKATLASAGLGVRFNLPYSLTGYTELAFPLTREVAAEKVNNRDEVRFFFDLTKRF